jgi:4-coumarate--CoA ligase
MPYQSRWKTVIPNETLPTYLFGSPHVPLSNMSDKPLLMDARSPDHHWLSRRSYRLWSQRFAAGLQAAGLKKGDRVLLFSGNTIFVPIVLVGTIMAGGVFTGANPTYTPRELAYQLSDSGAKFLICAEAALDSGIAASKLAKLPQSNVFVFDDGLATFHGRGQAVNDIRHWSTLIAEEEEGEAFRWEEFDEQGVNDTVVTLNYSSGTTGVPKGLHRSTSISKHQ